jgi:uncharacterized protein
MPDERGRPLCVFCRRQRVDDAWRPFCSERCKVQDLARWADGTYRVPAESVEEAEPVEEAQDENKSDRS